jgi:hypothetical protein
MEVEGAPVVWARGAVISARCPKSIITAQSVLFLEQFRWWKELGGDVWSMEAKNAEALLLLEQEWRTEMQNGKL